MASIAEIIKYEGDNSTFIWKHPSEDFNSLTQLIVHESQEAIFFMNGQALDLFGPGRHTLEAQNIPLLRRLLNRTTGDKTPFHCEVYFINKTVQMAVKWGTDSKVRFLEPTYGVPLELGAYGEMSLMVSDPRKLLLKLVGTTKGIAWEERSGGATKSLVDAVKRIAWNDRSGGFTKSLAASFRPLISSAVKANLSRCIKSYRLNVLEIDESLGLLSQVLKESILPGFEEYGLTIPEFYVTDVLLPENDPNFKRIRELHSISLQQAKIVADRQVMLEEETTEIEKARRVAERDLIRAQAQAQATKMAGFAEAEIMRAQGYTQKDVLQAEVQKAYAEGIGNMTITGGGAAGDVMGLGIGMAAAGAMSGPLSQMFQGFAPAAPQAEQSAACPQCGATVPAGGKFCLECGTRIQILAENEMLCPVCGKKTPKGKFCMECGAPLVRKCPGCGSELPDGAKFCLECGTKL